MFPDVLWTNCRWSLTSYFHVILLSVVLILYYCIFIVSCYFTYYLLIFCFSDLRCSTEAVPPVVCGGTLCPLCCHQTSASTQIIYLSFRHMTISHRLLPEKLTHCDVLSHFSNYVLLPVSLWLLFCSFVLNIYSALFVHSPSQGINDVSAHLHKSKLKCRKTGWTDDDLSWRQCLS